MPSTCGSSVQPALHKQQICTCTSTVRLPTASCSAVFELVFGIPALYMRCLSGPVRNAGTDFRGGTDAPMLMLHRGHPYKIVCETCAQFWSIQRTISTLSNKRGTQEAAPIPGSRGVQSRKWTNDNAMPTTLHELQEHSISSYVDVIGLSWHSKSTSSHAKCGNEVKQSTTIYVLACMVWHLLCSRGVHITASGTCLKLLPEAQTCQIFHSLTPLNKYLWHLGSTIPRAYTGTCAPHHVSGRNSTKRQKLT
jgi:hypothetical protein